VKSRTAGCDTPVDTNRCRRRLKDNPVSTSEF
jgi:hypothetical protein